ncbi:hypothetical protein CANMA_000599 [Candida margitis]|uniref:uncharacterized protein n=1 Tax=Candida margitis TaxID=1775924 RepID=UPI002227A651|nr:uncharacterized protein CANMA_000599 [Candida margitis]KAI5970342.1 hypothetical protein CANMA_000599 [Candida margitis]
MSTTTHKFDFSRPIEQEEFDDTELETPVRFNPVNLKRQSRQSTNRVYRSFRANNNGTKSNQINEVEQVGESQRGGNGDGSNAGDSGLTIRSPPSLKFDKSVSLQNNERQRNQSPTPITRRKPPSLELSPVDHSPVTFKVTKPSIEKRNKDKKNESVTGTPVSRLNSNNDKVKQSILDRVNTTLESLKKTPSEKTSKRSPGGNILSPVNRNITNTNTNTRNRQPVNNYEDEEPDFVHIVLQNGSSQKDMQVPSLMNQEPGLPALATNSNNSNNVTNRDIEIPPLNDEDTLGNSTPAVAKNSLYESILNNNHHHNDRRHNLNNEQEDNYDVFSLGASNTTWWTAKQWSKLMKVVNSKLISRQDAINSRLLMTELGCLNKQDLQRRYDFLKQYKTK